jgi:hypothetical protein
VNFERRINTARQYFDFLYATINMSWLELQERHPSSSLTLPQRVTLIHPARHDELVTRSRFTRRFSQGIPNYETCASKVLWGYECLGPNQLEIDHLFPYALGGPTLPQNALYLCKEHNRAKGHDVHLVPWSVKQFAWLDGEISELGHLHSESR